jgi:integrase
MRGSIRPRHGARGTTYTALYRDGAGRQRGKAFTSQRAAEAFLNAEVRDQEADRSGMARGLPGGDWLDAFARDLDDRLARGGVKPTTVAAYKSILKHHIRPTFGRYRSDRITHRVVATWAAGLAEQLRADTLAVKTHNNILALWSALVSWSQHPSRRHVVADLATHLERARGQRRERLFLEPAALRALLATATDPTAALALHLAAYAGLRRGEIVGLQVGDVDLARRELHVRRALSGAKVLGPKTTTSARTIDLPRPLLERLERHVAGRPATAWLFPRADGADGPIHPDTLDDLVVPLFKAAKTSARLHTLRHTYASLLINQGEEPKYVSSQLGHASIQITLDTYGHLFRKTRQTAMDRLEATMLAPAPMDEQPVRAGSHLRLVT